MKTIQTTLSKLPYVLSYSRLALTLLILLMTIIEPMQNSITISVILVMALLTETFDSALAKRFKLYSVSLRQLDSKIDTFFWFSVLVLVMAVFPEFIKAHVVQIFTLITIEILVLFIGYNKFKKSLALHTYSAKVWAALLTITVLNLCGGNDGRIVFNMAFIWGILSQIEAISIILKLRSYRADVKSIFHLVK
ncbi:MAG TPA: hypothetical protein PLU73_00125 [Bacteroidia bacterium]|nr:hypothetical protein [Bacteroidia bacterium]